MQIYFPLSTLRRITKFQMQIGVLKGYLNQPFEHIKGRYKTQNTNWRAQRETGGRERARRHPPKQPRDGANSNKDGPISNKDGAISQEFCTKRQYGQLRPRREREEQTLPAEAPSGGEPE